MSIRIKNRQRGFTLVELSIVLVIIGLIIGSVLTGQQIIQNARVTNAINGIQSFVAQVQTYNQNYGALPGDDAGAATRFTNITGMPTNVGNGSGTLDGAFDAACGGGGNGLGESCLIWADLRAANLVKNQVPLTAQPPNPFNGVYGFQTAAFAGALTTTVLCLNNVPGAAAQAIDTRLDDGSINSGTIQASDAVGNAPSAGGYNSANTYTMCMRI